MYEEEHALNEKLKKEMKQIQQDLTDSKAEMDRLKSSSSAITASSTKSLDATSERRMTFTVIITSIFTECSLILLNMVVAETWHRPGMHGPRAASGPRTWSSR